MSGISNIEQIEIYFSILENSRDGINLLDLTSLKYIYMNSAQVLLTGYTTEEMNNFSAEEL